jgi:hypothetical protein
MNEATYAARQTTQRVVDRVRLLAGKDPEALAALDAFLGELLTYRHDGPEHTMLMGLLRTGGDIPKFRAAVRARDGA